MRQRLVYGIHAVTQVMRSRPASVDCVYVAEEQGKERRRRLADALAQAPRVRRVSPDELQRLTGTDKHQGVAASLIDSGPLSENEARALLARVDRPLVLVLDGVPAHLAPWRAVRLAGRVSARAAAIRLLGYLGWWLIRLGIGLGVYNGLAMLGLFDVSAWALPITIAAFAAVNALAYPALACLDAVLHLETRIRTEGLDIRLSRAPAGVPEPVLLAAHR